MSESPDGQVHDVVILGGGSGGYAAALRAGELGLSVVLVEKDKLGGTCLHRGCIPTKALLHAAEVADATRESAQFGIKATLEAIDIAGVNDYKDKVVGRLHKGLQGLVKAAKITYVTGEGRLVSPDTVEVDGTDIGRVVVQERIWRECGLEVGDEHVPPEGGFVPAGPEAGVEGGPGTAGDIPLSGRGPAGHGRGAVRA